MTFGHESWYNENYNTNINQMQIQNSKYSKHIPKRERKIRQNL